MSLGKELQALERQKQQELKVFHVRYLRTRRDLQRAVSPSRFVRKHMGVSMGVAAVLGFLAAPRPGDSRRDPTPAGPTILGHAFRLMRNVLSGVGLSTAHPESAREHAEGHPPADGKPPRPPSFLQLLLPMVLSQIDFPRIISELADSLANKFRGGTGGKDNGHPLEVSVADTRADGNAAPKDAQ
jgi:hypothetical protein